MSVPLPVCKVDSEILLMHEVNGLFAIHILDDSAASDVEQNARQRVEMLLKTCLSGRFRSLTCIGFCCCSVHSLCSRDVGW